MCVNTRIVTQTAVTSPLAACGILWERGKCGAMVLWRLSVVLFVRANFSRSPARAFSASHRVA